MFFLETPAGASMPLDADPVESGNIVIRNDKAVLLTRGEDTDLPRYTSHFATCPHAKRFRKERA
jgi:hypothetical protein